MKKIIFIFGVLISFTTMAKFEEQYGANEIKIEKFEDGVSNKIFTLKDYSQIYQITKFPTTKEAELDFQNLLNEIEIEKFKILNYTNIIGTKKITFLTTNKLVVLSKTMNEIEQLVLDITTLDKTEKFEQYLKINDVHESISLTIFNAKIHYKMKDQN
ncbi:hypothetical protein [Cetobacterium sp.]